MDKIEQLEIALKILKAEKEGKPLEWEFKDSEFDWLIPTRDVDYYIHYEHEIRLKPWTLGRTVNGHTLPEGAEWNPVTFPWEQADLPSGYRPAMTGERGRFEFISNKGDWTFNENADHLAVVSGEKYRTTRPIPNPSILTDEQKAAGWVEWHGGENPIPGKRCECMYRAGTYFSAASSDGYDWNHILSPADIIAYRAVEPEWVDLGPSDIPPGSVFRLTNPDQRTNWITCLLVMNTSVDLASSSRPENYSFEELAKDWQINRSIPLTGKLDPNAWEPCRKLKES